MLFGFQHAVLSVRLGFSVCIQCGMSSLVFVFNLVNGHIFLFQRLEEWFRNQSLISEAVELVGSIKRTRDSPSRVGVSIPWCSLIKLVSNSVA